MRDDVQCFVIMPFGSTREEELHHSLVYEHVIKGAIVEAGVKGTRIDRVYVGNYTLTEAIAERLRDAELVVADCSGNNPNVLFELGFRWAYGKPFVCISNRPALTAFWPKNFQIYDYTDRDKIGELVNAVKSSLAEFSTRSRCEREFAVLQEEVRPAGRFSNPFQDRVAAWRIERARHHISAIQQGEWESSARTPVAHVAHMFEGIIGLLEDGEEYRTVTNMSFWEDAAVGGPVSPLLEDNVRAAQRGVRVKRVFLIDKSRWAQATTRREIEAVLRRHQEAREKVEKSRPGYMEVKCLIDDFRQSVEVYGHFGLACQPDERAGVKSCVVVIPRKENTPISALRLVFSSDGPNSPDTAEYVTKFQRAFESAVDLDTMLSNAVGPKTQLTVTDSGFLKVGEEPERLAKNPRGKGSSNPTPSRAKNASTGRRQVHT